MAIQGGRAEAAEEDRSCRGGPEVQRWAGGAEEAGSGREARAAAGHL